MCYATSLAPIEQATVGVLGFTAKDQSPRAVAVTPYVVNGQATVTTTLALLTKAKMLRRRPVAALLANGMHLAGDVTVTMHRSADWYDEHIRAAERRKYPPAAQLLGVPGHRRLLWWYVGRVAMAFDSPEITSPGGTDRVTITTAGEDAVQITPLATDLETIGEEIALGAEVADGPACLLIHHETEGMAELLQTQLRGAVTDNKLRVSQRTGSLEPTNPSSLDQLRDLRALAKSARRDRPTIENW